MEHQPEIILRKACPYSYDCMKCACYCFANSSSLCFCLLVACQLRLRQSCLKLGLCDDLKHKRAVQTMSYLYTHHRLRHLNIRIHITHKKEHSCYKIEDATLIMKYIVPAIRKILYIKHKFAVQAMAYLYTRYKRRQLDRCTSMLNTKSGSIIKWKVRLQ